MYFKICLNPLQPLRMHFNNDKLTKYAICEPGDTIIWKKCMIKLLKYTNCKWGFAEDCLEVYEYCLDRLSNNLILEIVVKGTYSLYPKKYFEILNLTFWGRNLLTRRFGLHSNSRGVYEITDLPVPTVFRDRNMELLLLLSIVSPCCEARQFS